MFRLLLLCVRSPGTTFPTATLASQFVSHFAKCPCRWEDEARWAECYIHRRCREMQTGNRDEEGRSVRGWSRGVTVWRGEVWIGRVEREYTHMFFCCCFFSPSHILYIHIHRGRILFKRAVLKLYSCPCALSFTYAVDGWRTEPNVSTWAPASRGAAEETSWPTGKRDRAGKSGRFHSFFEDANSAVVLGEQIKQKIKKIILHVDFFFFFRSESAWVLFCYLLVKFLNPSMEICVLEEL